MSSASSAAIKLSTLVGREVRPEEAAELSEYLLACLTHVTNARPLFVLLNVETGALEWSAGGADFHDVLRHPEAGFDHTDITTLDALFQRLGLAQDHLDCVEKQIAALAPGASLSMLQAMDSARGKTYRMVMRKRRDPHGHLLQFTLLDISAFRDAARRTQAMAQNLLAQLERPGADGASPLAGLKRVVAGLQELFTLADDDAIAALAEDLSAEVTTVSGTMVDVLRRIENDHHASHWQPEDLNPVLRPEISTHSVPVRSWSELHDEVVVLSGDEPAIRCTHHAAFKNAYDFVSYAANILVIAPAPHAIFILNGPARGRVSHDFDAFVRALGVEENSRRTAQAFFEDLNERPALGVFAVAGENVEAWGRPGLYGGWQAMLSPSQGQAVDVRGLFHGLKNLLLHLQVLYVVKTRADVEQVQGGLEDTAAKITARLRDLECIARTGRRARAHALERVGDWLASARRVANGSGGEVVVDAGNAADLTVRAVPGEMDDTVQELVRNAFQHGAATVRIVARVEGEHLCLKIVDDGPGVSDAKLEQLRRVIATRAYDADLSTRADGTGNGILAAANAVARFVDGNLAVTHGPAGRGVEWRISLKLADS